MRRWIGRLLLILVVVGALGYTGFVAYMKAKYANFQWPMPTPAVIAQVVVPVSFEDQVQAIGTAEANESAALTATASDTVKAILFTEGQFVSAGTVILQLNDDEEQAALVEARKAYERTAELARSNALSKARLDQDKAKMDIAQAQVDDRRVVAPFDGVLGLRSLSVGDLVGPGTVITTLDDIDPLKVEFSVPETALTSVRAGLEISARSPAYPGEAFAGKILVVDSRVDPVTRSLKAKAEIPNPDGKLRPGMLMQVDVLQNRRTALAVSEEALVSQGATKMVMVLTPAKENNPEGKLMDVTPRLLTIGERRPGYVEVLSGLKEGEKIVIEGLIKAHPGGQVLIGGERTVAESIGGAEAFAVEGKKRELEALPPPAQGE